MASVSQVLYEVQHEKFLRWPSQMKTDPAKRDMTKYCDFHRDHGHQTNDYIQLKKEIEFMIRRGHLRRYVASEDRNRVPPPPPRQPASTPHQQPLGEINVISGGVRRQWGVQFSQEGPPTQLQTRGDTRGARC